MAKPDWLPLLPRQHPLPPCQAFFFCLIHRAGPLLSCVSVGVGHARPAAVRQTRFCRKIAGRACPAPTCRIRRGAFHMRPRGVRDAAPYEMASNPG